jgi:hypothetical protein
LVNGYIIFVVPVLARSEERLPLPFKFVEAMEGQGLTHAIVEDCSGGQPSYDVEIFHDGEGKSYFRGGWPKFFEDYGLREGWSLIFPTVTRRTSSASASSMAPSALAPSLPRRERRAPPRPPC